MFVARVSASLFATPTKVALYMHLDCTLDARSRDEMIIVFPVGVFIFFLLDEKGVSAGRNQGSR